MKLKMKFISDNYPTLKNLFFRLILTLVNLYLVVCLPVWCELYSASQAGLIASLSLSEVGAPANLISLKPQGHMTKVGCGKNAFSQPV